MQPRQIFVKSLHRRGLLIELILIQILFITAPICALASSWGPYRGVNVEPSIDERGIAAIGKMHVNLIRISFDSAPLMHKTAPYSINEANFAKLDRILSWCKKYHIRVVIDPHTTPGTRLRTTTLPGDPLWQDQHWHYDLVKLWRFIAKRYKSAGPLIAGYDLLNEPSAPNGYPRGGPGDWNLLAKTLVKTIRSEGDNHWIIVFSEFIP